MAVMKALVLLSIVTFSYCHPRQCQSDGECRRGECCVFVAGLRRSTSCQPLGGLDAQCRPGANVSTVHYMVCPCHRGFDCDPDGQCTLQVPYGS